MTTTLTAQITRRVKLLNEWQRLSGGRITFKTRKQAGTYIVIRIYNDGTKQESSKKDPAEIISFLDGFIKHYRLQLFNY